MTTIQICEEDLLLLRKYQSFEINPDVNKPYNMDKILSDLLHTHPKLIAFEKKIKLITK